MKNKTLIHAVLPGLFIAAGLQAGDAILTFEEMDTNANGYISMGEAKASDAVGNNFKQIDSNNSGSVDISEFQTFMGQDRMSPPDDMEVSEPGAAPY